MKNKQQIIIDHWIDGANDDYKQSFHSLCTENFTSEWIDKIKNIRTWIKQMLSD
jgi:hypothetical protein